MGGLIGALIMGLMRGCLIVGLTRGCQIGGLIVGLTRGCPMFERLTQDLWTLGCLIGGQIAAPMPARLTLGSISVGLI